jgi:hypothetical protein
LRGERFPSKLFLFPSQRFSINVPPTSERYAADGEIGDEKHPWMRSNPHRDAADEQHADNRDAYRLQ